mgnify:CR=1 FL=1
MALIAHRTHYSTAVPLEVVGSATNALIFGMNASFEFSSFSACYHI